MKNRKGYLWMMAGVLLVLAALGLTIYNIWDGRRAQKASEEAAQQLLKEMKEEAAGTSEIDPDMEVQTIKIDDNQYIGILYVPALDLSLPVMESWSYQNLKTAPCRYTGSVYQNNLVIAGHNYARHFSGLKNLPIGTKILFLDVEGHVFDYEISSTEILKPKQTKKLVSGEWDLTLFTCTYGGGSRYAIRCKLQ